MLSRTADSVYWMARFMERAENVARFVDVNQKLWLDLGEDLADQWAPLIFTTGDHKTFFSRYGQASRENVLKFLTFDSTNPNSILSCVQQARENARTIREIISSALWEELNRFYLFVRTAQREQSTDNLYEFFGQVKRASHLLIGVMEATMSRGEAWHFSRIGRLIERADKTSRILDVKYYILLPNAAQDVGTSVDLVQWSALLKSADALDTYRQIHGRIAPNRVIDFLVLDRFFPRSLNYCIHGSEQSLHAITGTPLGTFGNTAEQEMGRLRADLEFMSVQDIVKIGVHEFIDRVQIRLNNISGLIYKSFFSLETVQETQQLQGYFQ